jgi:hypothetical protein
MKSQRVINRQKKTPRSGREVAQVAAEQRAIQRQVAATGRIRPKNLRGPCKAVLVNIPCHPCLLNTNLSQGTSALSVQLRCMTRRTIVARKN